MDFGVLSSLTGEAGAALPRGERLWAANGAKPYMPREVPSSQEDIWNKTFHLDSSISPKSRFRHLPHF